MITKLYILQCYNYYKTRITWLLKRAWKSSLFTSGFITNYIPWFPALFFIDNIVAYVRKDGIPEKLTFCIRIHEFIGWCCKRRFSNLLIKLLKMLYHIKGGQCKDMIVFLIYYPYLDTWWVNRIFGIMKCNGAIVILNVCSLWVR